ncbi:MAG TPA: diguanylate cyclase [Candidatus Dormibacteraeota bacterium]|nr:diguanylate cyclase [Candidatus Dormibacteraeota bacterium]
MRILIADDDAMSRKMLQKTLETAGYQVTAVENGMLAKEQLCRPDGPRLALLDWIMPELDGPGVCRAVRQKLDHPYVYMVLLTSKESKADTIAGLESGADDYLTKPFNPEELKARLRTGLRILDLQDRLVEAREQMRFRATHDTLTHLWNRGVITDLLTRELARGRRERANIAVILGDLDHFKKINDTYGHLAGDEVLRETSRRLLASVRSYDYIGRYGGEEFLVVLSNCEAQHAFARAEQIRKAISGKPMETAVGSLSVTMSLGLLLSKDWGPRPLEETLNLVDAALYAAKAAGRDCVKLAELPADRDIPATPLAPVDVHGKR